MILKAKQVRAVLEEAVHKDLAFDFKTTAIRNFLNSISDLVDDDELDLAEVIDVLLDDASELFGVSGEGQDVGVKK